MVVFSDGIVPKPHRTLLYGPPGVGKTTLASKAPNPVVIDLERGSRHLNLTRLELSAPTFQELTKAVQMVLQHGARKGWETLIIDSTTALEAILTEHVIDKNAGGKFGRWTSIATPGFGQGQDELAAEWKRFLKSLIPFEAQGISIILVGHSRVKPVNDPLTDGYERFEVDVLKKAISEIPAEMDNVLFMRRSVAISKSNNKLKAHDGEAELICRDTPAALAKTRAGLPESIPVSEFKWETLYQKKENSSEQSEQPVGS